MVTLGEAGESTHTISKTLNPEWNVSFDLPIVGLQSLLLEAVCWDKDRFGKDYLGEFSLPLDEIFVNGKAAQEVSRGQHRERQQTNICSHDGTPSNQRGAAETAKEVQSLEKSKCNLPSQTPPTPPLPTLSND